MNIFEKANKWFKRESDNPYSKLVWMDAEDNQFKLRILDCRPILKDYTSWTENQVIAERMAKLDFEAPEVYREKSPQGAKEIHCNLRYPRPDKVDEGRIFTASIMEDKWNIYFLEGYLYFVRSWTGDLIYRAKVDFASNEAIVSMVEASSTTAEPDSLLVLGQVDFLIKSHLFKAITPVPIPTSVPSNPKEIVAYSTVFCGRWALYASYEDTTKFRL
jgi:hypothetical protein